MYASRLGTYRRKLFKHDSVNNSTVSYGNFCDLYGRICRLKVRLEDIGLQTCEDRELTMSMFAYDIGACVTLAGDVKRPTNQSREYFD